MDLAQANGAIGVMRRKTENNAENNREILSLEYPYKHKQLARLPPGFVFQRGVSTSREGAMANNYSVGDTGSGVAE
jgi:hypothetical protein